MRREEEERERTWVSGEEQGRTRDDVTINQSKLSQFKTTQMIHNEFLNDHNHAQS